MKFDYKNDNVENFHINHQISQYNSPHYNHFNYEISREETHHKWLIKLLTNFTLILAELLVIVLIAFYFVSPLNRIAKVSVVGNRTILTHRIVHDMKAESGDSVFRLITHKSRLKKYTLKKNVPLRTIYINFHHWNHIQVRLSEYPITAYLKRRGQYYAVIDNGRVAYSCTKPNQIDPVLKNFRSNGTLKQFIKSYRKLPNSVKPDVNKIKYIPDQADPNRIRVDMNDGNQIYANYANWSRKMKYYSAISKSMKKHGVINMELGVYSRTFSH